LPSTGRSCVSFLNFVDFGARPTLRSVFIASGIQFAPALRPVFFSVSAGAYFLSLFPYFRVDFLRVHPFISVCTVFPLSAAL